MPLKIVRNDITKMETDAIVNTASSGVNVGPGCDSAIYKAAGFDRLLEYRREKIGEVNEGEAFITPGFNLDAEYIIHAVSPLYKGGNEGEEEKLRACYRNSLRLARQYNIKSVAFPLLATGSFGYPKEEGMRIAVDEINSFLMFEDLDIYLVVFGASATLLGEKLYPNLEAYIDQNYVNAARQEEYGDAYFGLVRPGTSGFSNYSKEARRLEDRTDSRIPVARNFSFKPLSAASDERGSSARNGGSKRRLEVSKKETFTQRDEDASFCKNAPENLSFEEEHESKLEERMSHLSDTFSQYLFYLIQNKNMENAEVWKRAIIDKKIFSKIKNNVNYHPTKLTALCLCVGAKLNLDETRDLLARAGYALSPCDKTDIIFSFFIENEIYDMIELDIQLEEHGLPCIIA